MHYADDWLARRVSQLPVIMLVVVATLLDCRAALTLGVQEVTGRVWTLERMRRRIARDVDLRLANGHSHFICTLLCKCEVVVQDDLVFLHDIHDPFL